MLVPLGTDRPSRRRPLVVPVLLGLNVGVFVTQLLLRSSDPDAFESFMRFGQVWRHDLDAWTPVTSAFLHGDFMHILGNMVALVVFGPAVEDRFGRVGFSVFYLLGAAGSGLAHAAASDAPAIGASGAIASVTGAFLILFPNTRVKVLWLLIVISIFQVPAWWIIGLYLVMDLIAQTFNPANGIANAAHLGGYAFGIAVAVGLLASGALPREPYDLLSIFKNKRRRRSFRSAARDATPKPYTASEKPDPVADELAGVRGAIGQRVAEGNLDDAADRYLVMRNRFDPDAYSTTLPREAQYQVANHLYARGERAEALRAYRDLLAAYPNDKERELILVLVARIERRDMGRPDEALGILKELAERSEDPEIRGLAGQEMDAIRNETQREGA